MKNFTLKIKLQILLSLILCTLCFSVYAGEGSKQTTPDVNHRASLVINNDEYGNFARYGSTDVQRLYIRIQNPNSEKVYLGFTRARRTAPDNSNEIDSKFRIMKPDGTIAFASYNLTSSTANITGNESQRLSRAQNGPNGIDGVTTAGYTPIIFDPTGMPAGDYWIEFESNSSSYSELYYNYYDITVANNSSKKSIPGRIYSKRWAFAMNNVNIDFTGAFYVFAPDNGSTTGAATQNGFVNKINFNGAGFRPWYFNVAFNNTGPGNSGNAANDQKSVYNASDATKMSPKYEVFLNDPDINIWKNGTYNGNIVINGITNCGIGESNINISVFKSGTIEILLDFNGGDGVYTPGTKDVLTTQTVTASGAPPYAVSVPWNGKDGLGNTIAQGTNIPIVVSFGQAAFHFPIYDVEENQYGFSCTTVRPAAPSGYVLKFYWDDSAITYTGGSFDAKVNLTGCTPNNTPPGNCHRWNGFNDDNNNSPQYGNLNTINTWWYANRDFVTSTIVLPPFYTVALGTTSNVTCFGGNDGKIQINVTNGTGPFKYYINGETTTNTLQNLTAGTYNIKVVDANGCSANVNGVVITQPAAAVTVAKTSQTDVLCFGAATGAINITASGGVGPYTYDWADLAGTNDPEDRTALPTGTYTVTVKDSKGCSSTALSVTITQPASGVAVAKTSQTDVLCFGAATGAINITASGGVGPYTFDWADLAGTNDPEDRTNIPAGTYTVTVKDDNGCASAPLAITITQPASGVAVAKTSQTDVLCFGAATGAINITASGGVGPYTYDWADLAGTNDPEDRSNLAAGTYTVTVKDANGCSSAPLAVTITQPASAVAVAKTSQTDVLCFGAATGAINITASGGVGTYTYDWADLAGTNDPEDRSNLAAGTYTVTVKDANGCTAAPLAVTITQPASAVAVAKTSQTDVLCFGAATGAINITASGGVGPYTYDWADLAGTNDPEDRTNLAAGTYTVTVKDANGCSSAPLAVTITQPASAVAVAKTSQTDVLCFGAATGAINITASGGVSPYTYDWADLAGTNDPEDRSNLAAGTYTVTVKDANGCASAPLAVTITQPASAVAVAKTSQTDVLCFGAATGAINITASGGVGPYTYDWADLAGTNDPEDRTNLAAGTYTVTVKDANGCSSAPLAVTISQPASAVAVAKTSQTDVLCFGAATGAINIAASGGVGPYTYDWADLAGTNDPEDRTNLAAGTYTVTVKDANGCTAAPLSITITQPGSALSCSVVQNKPVTANGLSNGEATVTAIGGTPSYTYLWNNGETTQKAVALNAGTHSVTVKDANGCTTQCTVVITEPNVLSCSISQDSAVKCFGGNTGKATVTAVGGNGDYTYAWDNGETTAQAVALTAGLHSVTVTDKLGYTTKCTVTITQPQNPLSAVKSQTDVTCGAGNNGSATVTVSGGTAQYSYSWNTVPVQTTATASNLAAGNYTVLITDANGCTLSESFTILDGDSVKPIVNPLPETTTINCPAEPVFAQATATDNNGTIASLTYEDTIVQGNCAGAYTKTRTWIAKDSCGNVSLPVSQTIIVQDNTAPTWTTQANSLNVTLECSDAQGLATAQAQFPTASDLCDADVSNITKVSGQFVASEGCGNAGTYTNTWTVKDDCGNTSETFTQVITIEDTTAPTWTTVAGTLNATLECSDTQGLAVAQTQFPIASDLCDADVSNITKVSGQFVASEGCGNAGTYTNTWTVKDDCGNTSETFTQVITIQDTTAPTWTTLAGTLNVTLECSDAQGLAAAQAQFPIASDLCDADVSNITKVSGQFVASEGCGNAGIYTNTWTVKDDCGNTSETFTQVITIQDTTAPTWTTLAGTLNVTLECSDAQGLAAAQAQFPIASDLCDADVSNITKVSGQFVASESCSNAGTYTNTWTVKDDCGNTSATFYQVISIQDTTAPIFTGNLPLDIEVSCDAVPEPAEMNVSDNCNENLPIVFSEVKSGIENDCPTNYTLTRTWKISDCGGNTTTHVQVITVRDKTAPTGTAPQSVTNVATIDAIPAGSPSDIKDAADNCSPTVNITVADTNNGGNGCDGTPYILTRTYTLTDCAGNKTELVQTFTVESKVTVSGVPTNTSCFGGTDGSIAVTSSPGSTVVITNEKNEVVGNTNLPAGTYTLTATAPVNGENQVCTATATVVITQPEYTVKISGKIINVDTNTPIANVPVTLIPQGTTPGPIQMRITGADGMYSFSGMPAGDYLVQVQDANLNSAYQLYPVDSSLFFTTLEDCKIQTHDFEYGASKLTVLGDYVWYDTNSNGIQDEWYDANNDGVVTKNIPDSNGAVDYSQWEWIDLNGDGSYTGSQNVGELNAGGFGNALSPNVIVDGPNGYHKEVIVGIAGFWRERPTTENPYGEYTVKLVRDANFDTMAANLGFTGLVKVIPSMSAKNIAGKTSKAQLHTVCKTTTDSGYVVNVTPEDLVHLDIDFGVSCKEYKDIVANDDSAGPIAGINTTTTNVLNVLTNDTLEGNPVTASEVIITTVTPNEFLQLNADGSVDVLPNAPVGTLTMVYQICEADQTDNCDTATVTITIEAPVMTVTATSICINDVPYVDYVVTPGNFTPVNGVTIAWADSNNNVVTTMENLPLSGRVLWPGALVDEQGKGIDWPGWIFENNRWIEGADGFEKLRPTANVTISVNPSQTITISYPPADPYCTARPTFAIVANDDTPAPIITPTAQTSVGNVLTNDTLNGSAVNINDVTLTTTIPDPTGSITIGPDGTISVAPNTAGGTYTLTYQICEKADFGNCDTAIVTVTIIAPVIANDDTFSNIGCNTFGLVGNVLANDLKGRIAVTSELVNFTLVVEGNNTKTDPNITVDAAGNVNVSSLTPAGTYTYNYTICDKSSPENCDSAIITIIVVPNGVVQVSGTACNDDSTLVNLSNLLPEGTPTTGVWQDRNNTNALQGGILNPFGLALGNYVFEYVIADERCPRSIVLNMEINDDCRVLACGNVVVHNAFSPNGDSINDFFKIDNIDDITCYPGNTVEIYNRWGILVFETTNYNNTTNAFDGTSRGRTTVKQSDGLPTGTYFYIITYKALDGNNNVQDHKLNGYLYLSNNQ